MSNIKTPHNGARKTLMQSALFTIFAIAAFAPATSMAETKSDVGHWYNPQGIVWKNSTGLCWRSSEWTPADATPECDPELMAKAEEPAPKHIEAPAPVPLLASIPAPEPKIQTRKISFSAEELFDFDKAELRPAGKATLDNLANEITSMEYGTIYVTGHADRIGSPGYNQKLSERRAAAVNDYLITKGIPDDRTTSAGLGETQPMTKPDDCEGPVSKKLIACLQPDRRVEVEVKGSKEVVISK